MLKIRYYGKAYSFRLGNKAFAAAEGKFCDFRGFPVRTPKQDLRITEILESSNNKENETDKYNIVDILVKNSKDELLLIEVQNTKEIDYFHRMNYGQAKFLAEHISSGANYDRIKKVYSINIVYFDLGQGKDYVYKGTTNFIGMHQNDTLELNEAQKNAYPIKEIADIFTTYYLLKVNTFDDIAIDSLDEWIYFLKNSVIKDEFRAKGLEEAKEILREVNMTQSEKIEYDRYIKSNRITHGELKTAKIEGQTEIKKKLLPIIEKERKAKEKALKQKDEAQKKMEETQGKTEEANQTIRNTILNLKASGMEPARIATLLGLSVDEVEKFIKTGS